MEIATLIEAHRGRIWATSEGVGRGATMVVAVEGTGAVGRGEVDGTGVGSGLVGADRHLRAAVLDRLETADGAAELINAPAHTDDVARRRS